MKAGDEELGGALAERAGADATPGDSAAKAEPVCRTVDRMLTFLGERETRAPLLPLWRSGVGENEALRRAPTTDVLLTALRIIFESRWPASVWS